MSLLGLLEDSVIPGLFAFDIKINDNDFFLTLVGNSSQLFILLLYACIYKIMCISASYC